VKQYPNAATPIGNLETVFIYVDHNDGPAISCRYLWKELASGRRVILVNTYLDDRVELLPAEFSDG
jgi:hypothetical protein